MAQSTALMSMGAHTCLLGIDVGASGTKAVLFDPGGVQWQAHT